MDYAWSNLHWLVVALLALVAAELWRRTRGLPPGPWGLPIVGFYPFIKPNYYIHMYELSKKYGDVFSFRTIGGSLMVVLNGTSIIKEIFVNRADEFIGKVEQLNILNWVDGGLGIAQAEGTAWKEQRKFFVTNAKNFGFGKVEYEGYLVEFIKRLIKDVRSKAGKSFDIYTDISHVTCNAIFNIMCNRKLEKEDPTFSAFSEGFHEIVHAFSSTNFFLTGRLMSLYMAIAPWARRAEMNKQRVRSKVSKLLQEHIKTFDPQHLRDFTDSYLLHMKTLEQKGQLRGSSFTMERLSAIIFNMLLEGTESTGSTIASLLVGLARYPDAQKKAQKEIDEIVGPNRLPSWADKAKMPYMDALIQELYRMHMFFFTSTFYSNFEDTTIAGYRIPKRTIIVANFWTVNNDPKYFPNPSKFHPERYLGEDGKRCKVEQTPIPFGIGKRTCIGEALAQVVVFLIISSIIQNFNLYPGSNENTLRIEPRTKAT